MSAAHRVELEVDEFGISATFYCEGNERSACWSWRDEDGALRRESSCIAIDWFAGDPWGTYGGKPKVLTGGQKIAIRWHEGKPQWAFIGDSANQSHARLWAGEGS